MQINLVKLRVYWLGKTLGRLAVDTRQIELYALSGFILHRKKFIAQLLTQEASCALDNK